MDPTLAAARRSLEIVVFAVLPLAVTVSVLSVGALHGRAYGIEFKGNFWQPAKRILAGESPYELGRLRADLAGRGPDTGRGYIAQAVYPAPAHVAAVPAGLLPFTAAMALFTALSVACIAGSMFLVGVRDWRCYGIPFLGFTMLHTLTLGGVTPLLVLGAAAAWRFRDTRLGASASTAALVAAKLFLLPLTVWLAATRRLRTAILSLAAAAALVLLGWAAIGFAGLTTYPRLLAADSALNAGSGYSLRTAGMILGLGETSAESVAAVVGLLVLTVSAVLGRRGNSVGSFALALAAGLCVSPIVWQQYYLLLLVPLAIARPRLSPAWLLLLSFWLAPREGHQGKDLLLAWATTAAVALIAVRQGSPGRATVRLSATAQIEQ